jgi:response regulator RpfG family c-di-GMP phosphodiesterase
VHVTLSSITAPFCSCRLFALYKMLIDYIIIINTTLNCVELIQYMLHPLLICTAHSTTAYVDDETYRECMNCGVDKFFSKPFSRASVELYTRQYESDRRALGFEKSSPMVEA